MTDHDIQILSDGEYAIVSIQTNLKGKGGNYYIEFKCKRDSEFDALLLAKYLSKRHADKIRDIRKTEFFSGWKHAKAKKRGKSFFKRFRGSMLNFASHS